MSKQYRNVWIVSGLPESEVASLLEGHLYSWTPWSYEVPGTELSCCFITCMPVQSSTVYLNLNFPYVVHTGTLGSYAGSNLLNESGYLTLRGSGPNQDLQHINWEVQRERWKIYKMNKLLGL